MTTTVTQDSMGVSTVRVKNSGPADLTGFLFIYTLHRTADGPTYGASTSFYDSTTDSYASPVPRGQEILLPLRLGGNGFMTKFAVGAGIFADGSTFGEKVTVQRIVERRGYMLVTLNKSITELTQASQAGMTRDRIVGQFQSELNMEMSAALNPDLTSCIQSVRGQVIATLRSIRQPDGSTPPLEPVLQSLVAGLKARRDVLKKALE